MTRCRHEGSLQSDSLVHVALNCSGLARCSLPDLLQTRRQHQIRAPFDPRADSAQTVSAYKSEDPRPLSSLLKTVVSSPAWEPAFGAPCTPPVEASVSEHQLAMGQARIVSGAKPLSGCCRLSCLRGFNDFIEDLRKMDREFTQSLAIQFDIRLGKTVDKSRVRNATFATCGRDSCDPQLPKFAFSDATITVRIGTRTHDRFFDGTQQFAAATKVTLGFLEKSFLGPSPGFSVFDSHGFVLCCEPPKEHATAVRTVKESAQTRAAIRMWPGKLQGGTECFDDILRVLALRNSAVAQPTLAFRGLSAQQVTAKSAAMLGFSRRRNLKPAFHPFVSLLLWHCTVNQITTEQNTEQMSIGSRPASRGV